MSAAVTTRTLAEHVAAYLSHWRALGRRYRQEEWLLSTLARGCRRSGMMIWTLQPSPLVRPPPGPPSEHPAQVGSDRSPLLPVPATQRA